MDGYKIQQHGMLGVHGRGLVGPTAEIVERRLVDRALLQLSLPREKKPLHHHWST